MQKLVKKTLHYETIMPVEAYEYEDVEEAYFWTMLGTLTAAGALALGASTPVGAAVLVGGAAVAVIDHYYHDEMVDAFETYGEGMVQQQLHNMEVQQAMGDMISDGTQAVVDTIVEGIEALGDYEPDTPGPASGPLQPVH